MPIKIGAAISGPRIADTKFTDTKRIFLNLDSSKEGRGGFIGSLGLRRGFCWECHDHDKHSRVGCDAMREPKGQNPELHAPATSALTWLSLQTGLIHYGIMWSDIFLILGTFFSRSAA